MKLLILDTIVSLGHFLIAFTFSASTSIPFFDITYPKTQHSPTKTKFSKISHTIDDFSKFKELVTNALQIPLHSSNTIKNHQ
jgi:hypothetical protein